MRARRTYTTEFKLDALRLLETSGKSATQIERDLGIGDGCLRHWKKKLLEDGENAFPGHGRMTPEQEQIRRLKRRLETAEQERDILKKAIAIFSQAKK